MVGCVIIYMNTVDRNQLVVHIEGMKNKTNGQPVFRRPASRPLAVRKFKLRVAGLADVNRMKYELTMLAVAS